MRRNGNCPNSAIRNNPGECLLASRVHGRAGAATALPSRRSHYRILRKMPGLDPAPRSRRRVRRSLV